MSLTDTVSDGLKSQGISADKIKDAVMSNDFVNNLTSTTTSMMKEVQATITKGSNMISATLDSVSGTFPDAVTDIFSKTTADASPLSDIASTVAKGAKEVDAKLEALAGDSSEALAKPISFVTKAVKDTINASESAAGGLSDLTEGLTGMDLSNIANATGIDVKDNDSLSAAFDSLSSTLTELANSASTAVSDLKSGIAEPITSSITDYTSSFMNSLNNTVDSVTGTLAGVGGSVLQGVNSALSPITSTGNALLDLGQGVTDSVLDVLPEPIGEWVAKKSDAYINEAANKLLGDNAAMVNSIVTTLSGADSSDNILQKVLSVGTNPNFPLLCNSEGTDLSSFLGSANQNTIESLYAQAKALCSAIQTPDMLNARYNKTLYDTLLTMAADFGITDLVNQLKQCSRALEATRAGNAKIASIPKSTRDEYVNIYWDENSVKVLQAAASRAAKRGDVSMYRCIQENIGSSQMVNAEQDVKILVTNTRWNKDEEGTDKKEKYNSVISDLGYTTADLVTSKVSDSTETAYCGAEIVAMTANNIDIVDEAITPDDRILVQAAMLSYAA